MKLIGHQRHISHHTLPAFVCAGLITYVCIYSTCNTCITCQQECTLDVSVHVQGACHVIDLLPYLMALSLS